MTKNRKKKTLYDAPLLEKIVLEQFGKFHKTNFDLSNTTIFLGTSNEAGKTTVFDAFYYALCNVALNDSHIARYADNLNKENVKLVWNDNIKSPPKIDKSDFLNIYAIRASQLNIFKDSIKEKTWLRNINSQLLSSQIDINQLFGDIEKRCSESKQYPHNKELARLQEKHRVQKHVLQEEEAGRDKLQRIEQMQESLLLEITQKEQELHSYEQNLSSIQAKLEIKELQEEISRIRDKYADIDEIIKLKKFCKENKELENDTHKEYLQIQKKLEEHQQNHAIFQAKKKDLEQEKIDKERDYQNLPAAETEDAIAKKFDEINNEIMRHLGESTRKESRFVFTNVGKIKHYLVSGFLLGLFLSMVAIVFFLSGAGNPVLLAIGLGVVFLLIATMTLFISGMIKFDSSNTASRSKEFIQQILRDYPEILQANVASPLAPDGTWKQDLFEWQKILFRKMNEFNNSREKRKEMIRELQEKEQKLKSITKKLEETRQQIQEEERAARAWLSKQNVRDEKEYIENMKEYRDVREKYEKIRDTINDENPENLSLEQLQREIGLELTQKKEILDETDPRYKNENESKAFLKKAQIESSALIFQIEEKIDKLKASMDQNKGALLSSFLPLERKLEESKQKMSKLEEEIAQDTKERIGAKIALGIIAKIKDELQSLLQESVTDMFSQDIHRILPQVSASNFHSSDLNLETLQIPDADNTARKIDDLSSGTRDCFLFALRLALARRLKSDSPSFLFLDDPFVHMDKERVERCLEYLCEFQNKYNWQLFFFTKDKNLADKFQRHFQNPMVHLLEKVNV